MRLDQPNPRTRCAHEFAYKMIVYSKIGFATGNKKNAYLNEKLHEHEMVGKVSRLRIV